MLTTKFVRCLAVAALAALFQMDGGLGVLHAAEIGETYTIAGEDGYGIMDCMHTGSECGRLIADSWCEAHGHAHVLAYGQGGDVTGSVKDTAAAATTGESDVIIRCGD